MVKFLQESFYLLNCILSQSLLSSATVVYCLITLLYTYPSQSFKKHINQIDVFNTSDALFYLGSGYFFLLIQLKKLGLHERNSMHPPGHILKTLEHAKDLEVIAL